VAAPRDGGGVRTGEVTLFDRLPEIVRLGTRSRIRERLDLVSELRWRRLSRVGTDDLRTFGGDLAASGVPQIYPRPRGMHNALAIELGVEEIEDGEWLRLGARVGYDSGVVPEDSISARAPWGHHLTGGVGAQFRVGRWVIQAAYNVAWQIPITVEDGRYSPIDRLDCVDSGYDFELPACDTVRDGYGAPSNDGEYRRLSHVGRLTLRMEFP
jgi:hypothetical protein